MTSRKVIPVDFGKKPSPRPKRTLGSIIASTGFRTITAISLAFGAGMYIDDCDVLSDVGQSVESAATYLTRSDPSQNKTAFYSRLRNLYVCDITDEGLTECVSGEPYD